MVKLKQFTLSIVLVLCMGHVADHVQAQVTLDQRIGELSKQISDGLTENQKQTIAVVEFGDLEGRVTNFGRFIAEELITRLYQTKKFKVIERQLLNKVVAEQKLSLGGMIDQTSAQKLGKLLGVDAIASGTVTDLGKSVRINARLISTGTGEVFAVAATEIAKDDSVMALMGVGNAGPTGNAGLTNTTGPTSNSGSSGASRPVPNGIASKDIGSLRVVLKSVLPVKVQGSRSGIRCSFEFINLETQRPIAVAMNDKSLSEDSQYLRATLVDENGGEWILHPSNVAGMSIVGVGQQPNSHYYAPAEIVIVLSKRDDLNSNEDRYRFIYGITTEMPPGQNLTVTMTFVQSGNQTGAPPKVFQMATEIVVGIAKSGTKKSYTLYNLTFDGVSVRAGG